MKGIGIVSLILLMGGILIYGGTLAAERKIIQGCAKRGHYVFDETVALRCGVERNYVLQASKTLGEKSE